MYPKRPRYDYGFIPAIIHSKISFLIPGNFKSFFSTHAQNFIYCNIYYACESFTTLLYTRKDRGFIIFFFQIPWSENSKCWKFWLVIPYNYFSNNHANIYHYKFWKIGNMRKYNCIANSSFNGWMGPLKKLVHVFMDACYFRLKWEGIRHQFYF